MSEKVAHVRFSLKRDGNIGIYANTFADGKRKTLESVTVGYNTALAMAVGLNKLVSENEAFGFFGEEWQGKTYLLLVVKELVEDDEDVDVIIDDEDEIVDVVIDDDDEEAKPASEARALLSGLGL